MEEQIANLSQDDVLGLIEKFPVTPTGNKVIITVNVDEVDGNLVLSNNSFSEVQYVMSKGSRAHEVEAGQKVILDVERMMEYTPSDTDSYERVGSIKLKPIEVEGKMFALINDTYIDAKDFR